MITIRKWFEPRSNIILIEKDHLGDWIPVKDCCEDSNRPEDLFQSRIDNNADNNSNNNNYDW